MIAYLTPSLAHTAWLGALIIVILAYLALGGAAAGRDRFKEVDLVAGWAVAIAAVTLVGVTTRLPRSLVDHGLLMLAALAAAVAWRRAEQPLHPGWRRIVVLALPLILVVASTAASQWDEFTHWLPNARYLYEVGSFPYRGGPVSTSVYPAYPYGLAIPIVHASVIAGSFAENTGALFNSALLISFALVLVRLIALGSGRTTEASRAPGWGMCALALLAVTVLSPTFVPKIAFTAYADCATSVCVGFAGVIALFVLGALADGESARARVLAWQVGLTLTVLLSLKQVNLVLAVAVLAGTALAAWRDPRVGLRKLLPLAPRALVLPTVVYIAWRIYVALEIPDGEFTVRPIGEWFFVFIPKILGLMVLVLAKKGGYFALMLLALVVAARTLRRIDSPFGRLCTITATSFLLYNAFLFFCYVAAFGEQDAISVGSFWRYNMHLGMLALSVAVLGLSLLWHRHVRGWAPLLPRLGVAAIALILALPVAALDKLRFDLRSPKLHVRDMAQDMAAMLHPGDTLAAIDLSGYGTFAMIVRYEVMGRPAKMELLTGPPTVAAEKVREVVQRSRADYAWVHVPTPAIESALGVALAPRAAHLLARDGDVWREVKSWPYPGYTVPTDAD